MAILFSDITASKRAETASRESEERLRQVQEAARIGSFEFDRASNTAIASPEYLELYGLPGDMSGFFSYDKWVALVHPEDRARIEAETRAAVADPDRTQLDYEFRIVRADNGEVRWVTARTKLIRNDKGRFLRSLGAQWDVTAEKDAEVALRKSEERYRSFIAHSTEGIWLLEFDPPLDTSLPADEQVELAYRNGRFVDCNDAMAGMYGLAHAEDLIGKTLEFPLPSSDPEARAYLAEVVRSGYNQTGVESAEQDLAGNRKYFDNSMTGIVEDGVLRRLWGIQRDITGTQAGRRTAHASHSRAESSGEEHPGYGPVPRDTDPAHRADHARSEGRIGGPPDRSGTRPRRADKGKLGRGRAEGDRRRNSRTLFGTRRGPPADARA